MLFLQQQQQQHQNSNVVFVCVLIPSIQTVHFLLIQHGVSQEDIVRGQSSQALQDLVYDIASQANIHLEHVSNGMGLKSVYIWIENTFISDLSSCTCHLASKIKMKFGDTFVKTCITVSYSLDFLHLFQCVK